MIVATLTALFIILKNNSKPSNLIKWIDEFFYLGERALKERIDFKARLDKIIKNPHEKIRIKVILLGGKQNTVPHAVRMSVVDDGLVQRDVIKVFVCQRGIRAGARVQVGRGRAMPLLLVKVINILTRGKDRGGREVFVFAYTLIVGWFNSLT